MTQVQTKERRVQKEEAPLLTYLRTIATTDARPTIGWTSTQFKEWFDGVDDGDRAPNLTLRKLERPSVDDPIIDTFGGEERAKITKADLFAALAEKEARGDYTPLLGYVEDKDDEVRAVCALWRAYGGGWDVRALSVEHPDEWGDGSRVVSRPGTKA